MRGSSILGSSPRGVSLTWSEGDKEKGFYDPHATEARRGSGEKGLTSNMGKWLEVDGQCLVMRIRSFAGISNLPALLFHCILLHSILFDALIPLIDATVLVAQFT